MMTQQGPTYLQWVMSNTASGKANTPWMWVNVRVMSCDRTKVVQGWKRLKCRLYHGIPERIFRGKLGKDKFICEHPHLEQLWVTSSKYELYKQMPK